jgi:triosephosphate isomerase (TIM)
MLKDAGASAGIVGHSERRQHHGETDAMVAAKAKAAWRAGILAIICIGETESQRLDGKALSVCSDQIAGSVPEGMTLITSAIAYEPQWAIGTGRTATSDEIAEMHAHIRQGLVVRLGAKGKNVRILYGGAVNLSDAREILAVPEVGGVRTYQRALSRLSLSVFTYSWLLPSPRVRPATRTRTLLRAPTRRSGLAVTLAVR